MFNVLDNVKIVRLNVASTNVAELAKEMSQYPARLVMAAYGESSSHVHADMSTSHEANGVNDSSHHQAIRKGSVSESLVTDVSTLFAHTAYSEVAKHRYLTGLPQHLWHSTLSHPEMGELGSLLMEGASVGTVVIVRESLPTTNHCSTVKDPATVMNVVLEK